MQEKNDYGEMSRDDLINVLAYCNFNYTSTSTESNLPRIMKILTDNNGWKNTIEIHKKIFSEKNGSMIYYDRDLIEIFEACDKSKIGVYELLLYCERFDFLSTQNLSALFSSNLLTLAVSFSNDFRGNILDIIDFDGHKIIKTIKDSEYNYYNSNNVSVCHMTFNEVVLNIIFDGNYTQTLMTLLKSIEK